MAINIPESSSVVKARVRSSIQTMLQLSNPMLRGSWIGAIVDSFAERVYDFYYAILAAIDEVFPDTTTVNLERWGAMYNLQPNAAKPSVGKIVFQSANTAADDPIPVDQRFVDGNGNVFVCTELATVEAFSDNALASSLTRTSTTATFVSDRPHFLKSGGTVTIAGASDAYYNGEKTVTVVDDVTFTFTVNVGAATPATGAYFARFGNSVSVKSETFGVAMNLPAFTAVTLQSPVANILDDAFVDYQGLSGAADRETTEEFRARVLDVIRNPVAHFNVSDITRVAKEVTGITRVFVNEATPAAGQVTVYVTTDNDVSPIPNATTVAAVKSKILTIKPANVSDADVIVSAPTKKSVDFVFTALSPNTSTMRASILENLKQFFADNTSVGADVVEDAYRSAIFSTIDTSTGEAVVSFTITSPSGTVNPTDSELPALGTVTWP